MKSIIRWLFVLGCLGVLLANAPHTFAQDQSCFVETAHCMSGRIRSFWEQNGGLATFGYPITDQHIETIEGRPLNVQWFERARLELHPENAAPYDVLLGRLGVERLQQQGRDWTKFPKSEPGVRNDCEYFPVTAHFVCAAMHYGWSTRGLEMDGLPGYNHAESLALLGQPLDDEHTEVIDGKQLSVQWFERGRLEFHPENQLPYNVLGGLLGSEIRANQPSTPAAAPTGQIIYLDQDGATVKRVQPDGSGVHTLFTIARSADQTVANMSANPDGSVIIYGMYDSNGLHYFRYKQGAVKSIGTFVSKPRWSPTGNAFVLQAYDQNGQEGAVYLYDVATDLNVQLPIRGTPDWFPDSNRLVYVEHPSRDAGLKAANVSVYDITTRQSTRLTTLSGEGQEAWVILEAHVLPGGQQVIFFGGQPKNLGASGNGMQWWWIPATGGTPKAFSGSDGNGVVAYSASPNGEWVAYGTQMHVSACASEGRVTISTSDVRGGVAADAPLPHRGSDNYAFVQGLSWEPNSNYLAMGVHSYHCVNAGEGPQVLENGIYVWKIRLINTNGAVFVKIADGTLPVWVR